VRRRERKLSKPSDREAASIETKENEAMYRIMEWIRMIRERRYGARVLRWSLREKG